MHHADHRCNNAAPLPQGHGLMSPLKRRIGQHSPCKPGQTTRMPLRMAPICTRSCRSRRLLFRTVYSFSSTSSSEPIVLALRNMPVNTMVRQTRCPCLPFCHEHCGTVLTFHHAMHLTPGPTHMRSQPLIRLMPRSRFCDRLPNRCSGFMMHRERTAKPTAVTEGSGPNTQNRSRHMITNEPSISSNRERKACAHTGLTQ